MKRSRRDLVGIEYEVDASSPDPNYLVVRKQRRESPTAVGCCTCPTNCHDSHLTATQVSPLAVFYVVGEGDLRGTVYALPVVHDVLLHNLVRV